MSPIFSKLVKFKISQDIEIIWFSIEHLKMTQKQYDKSIATGELQLNAWGKFSYFWVVGFLFFIPIMCAAFDLFDKSRNFVSPPIWFIIIPTILGILLYWLQKSQLKFKIVKTRLGRYEFSKLTRQISEEFKLTILFKDGDIFVAETTPELFSGIWAKQITILLNKDVIMISSIFELTRKSSVDIIGSNKKAVNTLIDKVEQFEKSVTR